MPTDITVPEMGESINEAVILRWIKQDGDEIAVDEPICELETDKATFDLPSTAAGTLKTTKEVGATVRVGEVVAQIAAAAATSKAPSTKPASAKTPPRAASDDAKPAPKKVAPAERKAAAQAVAPPAAKQPEPLVPTRAPAMQARGHVDSGNGAQRSEPSETLVQAASVEAAPTKAPEPRSRPAEVSKPEVPDAQFDANGVRRVPMSKIRRRIAERLVRAQHTAAMLTTFNEIDMTAVLDLRDLHKEQFEQAHGVSLGLMSFFSRACVLALKQFPAINAEIDGNDVVYHQHVNLGVAVSTERGLVVPVLRRVEDMSFARIEGEIRRVAAAAREGKLSLQELSGGTFTITNGGVFGSLLSTPILNPPQSGILGMHVIQKRPVVINDRIKARRMMYVALSYDHRLVDGRDAVSFLVKLKKMIEDPVSMILEV